MISKLEKIFRTGSRAPAGCGFLSRREIEKWLEGRLAVRRREAFRRHRRSGCSACSLLAADLETFCAVATHGPLASERKEFRATEAILRAHLRQKIDTLEEKRGAAKFSGFSWNYALATATAAMLLAVVAIPFLRGGGGMPQVPTLRLPGGEFYEVPAMPFSERPAVRGVVSLAELWQRAGAAYTSGDFRAAEPLFAAIVERDPYPHDAMVYRGNTLIMTGRYEEAVEVLTRAREIGEDQGLHGADDNYYLAIALWKLGDETRAIEQLELARSAGGHFGREAEKLLAQLRDE